MVPTRGTSDRDETAAGSLLRRRSSVLSRPRRSAVENSFSSSSFMHTGSCVSTGGRLHGPLMLHAQKPSSQRQPRLVWQQVHFCITRAACVWGSRRQERHVKGDAYH